MSDTETDHGGTPAASTEASAATEATPVYPDREIVLMDDKGKPTDQTITLSSDLAIPPGCALKQ
jgi:hypothetical protein